MGITELLTVLDRDLKEKSRVLETTLNPMSKAGMAVWAFLLENATLSLMQDPEFPTGLYILMKRHFSTNVETIKKKDSTADQSQES